MRIVLGVGGGIAAYKAAMLLRLFSEAGHHVVPIPTRSALEFVGAATWEALSGEEVTTEVFDRVPAVNHVGQGQAADLVVIAPATADLLARAAHGHADDLLTTTLLATRAPVLFAPAMHTEMWLNAAVQENVATLRRHGHTVLEPADGRLTGKDSGPGRLPEPEIIRDAALGLMPPAASSEALPLAGVRALVSAGGTQEPLDPVRYLGNRSSGKQGVAVAKALHEAGADVDLVAAHVDLILPQEQAATASSPRFSVHRAGSAQELEDAMARRAEQADVIVMTAAVADFRPAEVAESKIKKTADPDDAPVIRLVRNPDILRGLVERRDLTGDTQVIVGFAAETGDARTDPLDFGRAKLERKGCDLLCVNQVGRDLVFGQDTTKVTVLAADGSPDRTVEGSKDDVAAALTQAIAQLIDHRR
ncbi:bifunctional phosphopantothenoylcysteine decarboxylase/phosphopantothenate--cysteine ligase CoaBC [Kocuria coralli]|uniref:Coenzyme A biosynthesis bifunctional protein CoaBC n=1 Tax=Kocuria coralli TaxID=1461025 RepID=A0A5J5KZH8_9MICC|nr:bifunctional phosphopantothenoylcysteine decarboxylase/phosphopantothenate--cysteine ligase CoaBC [Kocuria coralli]KAA9395079.1 bifunctional phosphopantothenoylcysteine decarboxylase/phosphopantothenate--cysteine ligase CoaBC [Kocuria coralli]